MRRSGGERARRRDQSHHQRHPVWYAALGFNSGGCRRGQGGALMIDSAPPSAALHDEIAALRQQLAASERAHQQAEQRAQLYEAVVQQMPIVASVWHLEQPDDLYSLRLVSANPACVYTAGFDLSTEVGRTMTDIFGPSKQQQVFADVVLSGQPRYLGEVESQSERVPGAVFMIQAIPLPNNHLCILSENITERKRAEEAIRQRIAHEETIRAQQAALAELSTPLIPISDQVMVMPLIGAVDSRRAQQVIETLLEGIARSSARIVILDITGVPVVDTQVANGLLRAAQAVKLLGAQVLLTGIRPEVAQTLVGLGADLSGIVTRGSLQTGIAYAISRN
jgi:rsbT co-antagonist protein RsbR